MRLSDPEIDARLQEMFSSFEGEAEPLPPARPRRRNATRRTALVAALVTAVVLVPLSLGVTGLIWQAPGLFVADHHQPANARHVIEQYIASQHAAPGSASMPALKRIAWVLSAKTGDAAFHLYALRFSDGQVGLALITDGKPSLSSVTFGWPTRCTAGWAMKAPLAYAPTPGRMNGYVAGTVAPAVTSVRAYATRGKDASAFLRNGYFLAWVSPTKDGRPGIARVVASNRAGNPIGRLDFTGDGTAPRSNRGAWCG